MIFPASPSRNVNVWRIKLVVDRLFLFPCAHVVVYDKNGKWKISDFIQEFREGLKWEIPKNYVGKDSYHFDLAWAEVHNDKYNGGHLIPDINSECPVGVSFFFRQAYDLHGRWIRDKSGFVALDSTLYKTPGDLDLYEALESGAIAVHPKSGNLVGMLVRRGATIDIKRKAIIVTDPIIIALNGINKRLDSMEARFVDLFDAMEAKFDAKLTVVETKFDARFDALSNIKKLDNEVIKREDLADLLTVVGLRRAIILLVNKFMHLINGESINIEELEGTPFVIKMLIKFSFFIFPDFALSNTANASIEEFCVNSYLVVLVLIILNSSKPICPCLSLSTSSIISCNSTSVG